MAAMLQWRRSPMETLEEEQSKSIWRKKWPRASLDKCLNWTKPFRDPLVARFVGNSYACAISGIFPCGKRLSPTSQSCRSHPLSAIFWEAWHVSSLPILFVRRSRLVCVGHLARQAGGETDSRKLNFKPRAWCPDQLRTAWLEPGWKCFIWGEKL